MCTIGWIPAVRYMTRKINIYYFLMTEQHNMRFMTYKHFKNLLHSRISAQNMSVILIYFGGIKRYCDHV